NSLTGSRKNISMHYDLSNDFFKLFLDQTMLYSSARFMSARDSLKKAQLNKVHDIIEKLQITKTDHVLEIGCGWGGFAIEAARKTGCRVTGVTISEEQYAYAKERVQSQKLQKLVSIELLDYRKLSGTYDKIVSIEMAEAVGAKYLGEFVHTIDRHLKKDGLAFLQCITMPDNRHDHYKRSTDWIRKYIFNGGHLLSLTELCTQLKRNSTLFIHHLENIGVHYAKTLHLWRENFEKNVQKIEKLGFDGTFIRKWRYYLASCEAAFETRMVNDIQIILTRENNYHV
ncbi:MAG: class I SAM-dependent methyltransferase, partial [Spirochaetota bacterium]